MGWGEGGSRRGGDSQGGRKGRGIRMNHGAFPHRLNPLTLLQHSGLRLYPHRLPPESKKNHAIAEDPEQESEQQQHAVAPRTAKLTNLNPK